MTNDPQPRRRGRPPSGGREAILDAAVALVREEGISKLTSRELAARAGVSDASVYYHFKDRRGLLQAVYAHGMEPLKQVELQAGASYPEALAATFASLERFFEEILPILYSAQADVEVGQAVSAFIEDNDLGPHRGVSQLADYLRAEQAAGRVNPDTDVEAVALLLIDAAYSRVSRHQLRTPDDDDARLPSPERLLASLNQLLEPPVVR